MLVVNDSIDVGYFNKCLNPVQQSLLLFVCSTQTFYVQTTKKKDKLTLKPRTDILEVQKGW